MEVVGDLIGVLDTLSDTSFDDASIAELLEIQTVLEQVHRRVPAIQHRVLAALIAQAGPADLGARSWADALGIRLRLSNKEAHHRLTEAQLLAPRRTVTGQPQDPVYPATSAAQARGAITAEHIRIITKTLKKLPAGVDGPTRADAEAQLATYATAHDPDTLRRLAKHLLEVLDPDGPEPNDDDAATRRQDRRNFVLGPQDKDGNSDFHGTITPEGRAYLEPMLGKLAGPGMCNPEDEIPCTKGTPSQQAIDADTRTLGQRQHDALITVARNALASGELGQHNGLPVTVVLGATLAEFEEITGQAVTAGGSRVPMGDVIRMAAHAWWCVAVFDDVTGRPLHFGRTRRCASPDQRLVLTYRHRGCTFPGCRVPAYGCQVHHAKSDFARDGHTDIEELVLACGPHNRLVGDGRWTTVIAKDGSVEWIPPASLDTGQARTNAYHHPEVVVGDRNPGRTPRPDAPPGTAA
ncbi:HNH endonuclease signature motif containing protein [Mycolicibacterium sp. 120266]|uniref:HNH endonuclease signature motif containing protein n=1 Tax=Mycolicibacterium sp. 120266 TaxID=3090601 RepID=UPI00299DC7F1|nr:HNH endonuclease signature motif containing protein [Mycolicibacterium sp. 120266]MDX1875490.1 HNH endonuclease signature motif containing protein [Mycolicibacterium sp. 120266]